MVQFLVVLPMLLFMLTRYTDSHARSLICSVPIWLMWSCYVACCSNLLGIMMPFPFMTIPSNMDSSSLNIQPFLISWPISFRFEVNLQLCGPSVYADGYLFMWLQACQLAFMMVYQPSYWWYWCLVSYLLFLYFCSAFCCDNQSTI